ncbi:MAG TPA: magnesium transporter, partial [Bacillota bacterium]|nr:magnesium transporter [Bacillota bacterium]
TDDQIGSVMSTNYIEIPASMSVKDAMRKVTAVAGDTDYISILYAVDKQRLVGTLKLKELIVARASQTITDVMNRRFASARPEEDKETVARRMQDYGESSMPILDETGKLLGILTHDVMIDIISAVQSEDYGGKGGFGLGSADLETQTETTFSAVKSRLPWLAMLLGLSFLSSLVLTLFSGAFPDAPGAGLLAANLAVYLPLILDMSGNTGTQSLAVMIRFLIANPDSMEQKTVRAHLRREWLSGLIQALLLGALTFGIVCLTEALSAGMRLDSRTLVFATVTAFAIFIALAVANLLGALIPLLMAKLKFDPAVASGPFITTVADLVSLTLYYSISLIFLLNFYL